MFELLEDYWLLRKSFKEKENTNYFFWRPNYKLWCMEFLEQQWLPCLPKLKLCTQKREKLCQCFDPTSEVVSEHLEKLEIDEIKKVNAI